MEGVGVDAPILVLEAAQKGPDMFAQATLFGHQRVG